jgi:1-deoxy-D-xylulose-5-phosphate reductoisomerase
VLAQLGTPDMKGPIAFGMAWPARMTSGCDPLDFTKMAALTFEEADERRFPGLHLSWAALRAPSGSTAVLNAANEIANEAFLEGRLRFPDIHRVNAQALERVLPAAGDARSIEALIALDARARDAARAHVAQLAGRG